MKYLSLAESQEKAINKWNESQYDLSEVIFSLTDNGNMQEGLNLYAIFRKPEFLKIVQVCYCDFIAMKKHLGINGNYIEHKGDWLDEKFNPKRFPETLSLNKKEMKKRGQEILDEIINEMNEINELIKRYIIDNKKNK